MQGREGLCAGDGGVPGVYLTKIMTAVFSVDLGKTRPWVEGTLYRRPRVNLEAENLRDIIFTTLDDEGFTMYLGETGQMYPVTHITLPTLPETIPCHSQGVERRVALTSLAVERCVGVGRQNGTALAIEEDRLAHPNATL